MSCKFIVNLINMWYFCYVLVYVIDKIFSRYWLINLINEYVNCYGRYVKC